MYTGLRFDGIAQFLKGCIGLLLQRCPNLRCTGFQGARGTARKGFGREAARLAPLAPPVFDGRIADLEGSGNVGLGRLAFSHFGNDTLAEINGVRMHGRQSNTDLP
jgi:hypothetical protein